VAENGPTTTRMGDGRPPLRPLPGSVEEVEAIAALFPGRSQLYVGADANQDNVLGNPVLHQARWLHFATHGWIGDPAESGLVLSPDADDDPMLHVYEIFNLDLEAEAVVLSACDTGLGGTQRGEGLVGLSHAFFYAGAANVVVSLWPVADRSTGELMRRMYLGLADGLPPAEALRRAKLELIADGRFAGASHWAPFILVGHDR
jgi:CHAT domain-containing protein